MICHVYSTSTRRNWKGDHKPKFLSPRLSLEQMDDSDRINECYITTPSPSPSRSPFHMANFFKFYHVIICYDIRCLLPLATYRICKGRSHDKFLLSEAITKTNEKNNKYNEQTKHNVNCTCGRGFCCKTLSSSH